MSLRGLLVTISMKIRARDSLTRYPLLATGYVSHMTLPNQITLGRILLIPIFVLLAVYYGHSVEAGEPEEKLRIAAIIVFLVAALSDGVDGWLARHFRLQSRLGAILDPIADKGLMLTAIITLSVSNWDRSLPLWFPVLVITRDIIILTGCALLRFLNGSLEIRPSSLGKISTFFQMFAIAVVLLQWRYYSIIVGIAGIVTLLSGIGYIIDGVRLLKLGGHDRPTSGDVMGNG
ncbi:MAG: CDP-diacylglycerol--glycerol-3-phosphate 3-phosphatidyltransferase [Verrucomicrobia bacterium]|nr:MAG: CDP-diacylglycerol--glycerol-3-phosphate 3-phosphatidyltransferase [Verrucomicrobiota bacterium]